MSGPTETREQAQPITAEQWHRARLENLDPEWDRAPVSLVTLMTDRQHGIDSWKTAVEDVPFPGFTCDGCVDAAVCRMAFDPYNTHGDCLVNK